MRCVDVLLSDEQLIRLPSDHNTFGPHVKRYSNDQMGLIVANEEGEQDMPLYTGLSS